MTSEPQTESGRALHADRHSPECHDCGLLDRILAIEEEAASKAVAEVLDRLEQGLLRLPVMDMRTGPWPDAGTVVAVLMPAVAALIASERKP